MNISNLEICTRILKNGGEKITSIKYLVEYKKYYSQDTPGVSLITGFAVQGKAYWNGKIFIFTRREPFQDNLADKREGDLVFKRKVGITVKEYKTKKK
jgi:hypothetical protein